jgi:hypothetical protein
MSLLIEELLRPFGGFGRTDHSTDGTWRYASLVRAIYPPNRTPRKHWRSADDGIPRQNLFFGISNACVL